MKNKYLPLLGFVPTLAILIISNGTAAAATRVKGYAKSNGTYVAPSYRSNKDSSKYNNYSTKGNTNPYTGKKGYTSPTPTVKTYSAPKVKSYSTPKIKTYKTSTTKLSKH